MTRLLLVGGSDYRRSVIANAQRRINLYPEKNRADAPVPYTFYQRPGRRLLSQGPLGPVRGLWRASNGAGYCVIGQGVYSIDPNFHLTQIGALAIVKLGLTSATDNGTTILLVDGTTLGYTIDMATNVIATVVDGTGTFTGADRVDVIDTFVLWNIPGTNLFGSTLSNSITFDALYVAGKSNYPDKLVTLVVNRHQIILHGTVKSELWYDAGNPLFPFAELPGSAVEHGTLAKYSPASEDISTYWLGQDLQGVGIVFRQQGYQTQRVSNHALEYAIQQMILTVGQVSDAIGMTYQVGGHVFYMLTFPAGNQTWVYDAAIGDPELAWHQEAWTDQNGILNRTRDNCMANLYGQVVAGDWQNGALYAVDPNTYVDEVPGQTAGVSCVAGFAHLLTGIDKGSGQLAEADGNTQAHIRFVADIDCGNVPLDAQGNEAQVALAWSNDRGHTFRQEVMKSLGAPGRYEVCPQWRELELARDRVYELRYSINGLAALNGAWADSYLNKV